ncbi:AraC family transcriptional regulator [Paenibacillus sp. HB172176]|uniref:AraC family transcriptional regulator n=1 Tax=Paenibacillus sp. HB172176 TaxID=2493690 RepID=UPI00143938DB|nr:AraC family transcriptional regulator [Paenibacillus sp. HB172176]
MRTNAQAVMELMSSASLLLVDAKHASSEPKEGISDRAQHTLLLFRQGEGELEADGRRYELRGKKILLLAPHTVARFLLRMKEELDYVEIGFHLLRVGESGKAEFAELPLNEELMVSHFHVHMARAFELARMCEGDGWGRTKANIRFQELIVDLLQELLDNPEAAGSASGGASIQGTIDYMREHFRDSIKRELLSEMAGMSADYYTKAFKKRTGKTPTAYLTHLRINYAKQLLLVSNDSNRMIAQKSGFGDEFYFSRKFKSATGYSPSVYAAKVKSADKIVTLQHNLTGHLLALGVEPHGALINGYYPFEAGSTVSVGGFRPDLDRLAAVRPDLILANDIHDEETSRKAKIFDQIAPTVIIPYLDNWRTQLRNTASAIGEREKAEAWLDGYERKAAALRERLPDAIREERTLIVGIGCGKLCLFGQRNVGSVLHGDLGVLPASVATGIAHYREIEYEELLEQHADRILIVSYRNDGSPESKRRIEEMEERWSGDPRWLALKPVREGKTHRLLDRQHLYTLYTSYSHSILLDRLYAILMSETSK